MKKKLIAIVASLAMVATMVPATAFAAATPSKATVTPFTSESSGVAGDPGYAALLTDNATAGNLANITFMSGGSRVVAKGSLPYRELANFSNTAALKKGNYIGIVAGLANGTPDGGSAMTNWYVKTEATHTVGTSDIKTTDLIKIADKEAFVQRLETGKESTWELYNVADVDKPDASKDNVCYADVTDTVKDALEAANAKVAVKATSELTKWLDKKTALKVTLDTTGVTVLSEDETDALEDFVEAVGEIGYAGENDDIDGAYKRHVDTAQRSYDALAPKLQTVIAETELQEAVLNYKKAYNTLELAQKNVEGNALVSEVDQKIKALVALPEAFADLAAIETVYAPMAEIKADYDKLTTAQKNGLTYGTKWGTYTADYDKLIKAYVNPLYAKAAAINVEEALTAEDITLIRELKTCIDKAYITEPKINITGFDQKVYDALVAALDKVAKDESSLENATIAAIADQAYTGAAIEPAVTVTDKAGKEVPADDYTVIYSNNKDAGTATVTVAAKSSSAYTGSVSTTFTITPAALTDAMVKSVANATYTGKAVTPAVTVEKGVTYDVTYKNNTAVGKATATITGTGNYTGTITKTFIVKPAKEAISSLKAGKKSLTVAYKAQTGAKYRIVYSPAKGQAKAVNTTATKKTIKSLKAGKTYKVKVRAYKVVDGKTYNGTYSTVKKVKVK